MLSTNANFDAKHDVDYKTPMYSIHFDGELTDYCNHLPTDYIGPRSVDITDLVGYWAFDEESGTVAADGSGNENHGTLTNMEDADWVDGVVGNCLEFNGVDEYVSCPSGSCSLDGADFSISAWMYFDNFDTHSFISKGVPGADQYFHLGSRDSGCLTFAFYSDDLTSDTVLVDNKWYHVAATYNAATKKQTLYINGDEDCSRTAPANLTGTNAYALEIGRMVIDVTYYFAGKIDEVRIHDKVFTADEIKTLYINGKSAQQYLANISGNSQKVTPEEGKGSIGGVTITIQDYNQEITALLATDSYQFHRKKVTTKAGYLGMAEADMLSVEVGWVTGLKMSSDLLSWIFTVTDPQKWLQRKIFRDASESNVITVQGNPLDIYMAVLTSTGAGTNGDYDYLAAASGLAIDSADINISNIEAVRDDYFPGDSNYMKFEITEKVKAKDFLETEILKVLNCYPVIDNDGKINIIPFKPPIETSTTVQSFNEDNIIGLPTFDNNLTATINEIELHYNWEYDIDDGDYVDGEFENEDDYIDTDSLNNRGPGKKPLTIKSKGLHTVISPGSIPGQRAEDVLERRKNRIFGRFAIPPSKITISCFFSRWLSSAGDIVPLAHAKLPDIMAGTMGLTGVSMEIINRTVDWKNGRVKITLLNTGFDKGNYVAISGTTLIKSTNLITP